MSYWLLLKLIQSTSAQVVGVDIYILLLLTLFRLFDTLCKVS